MCTFHTLLLPAATDLDAVNVLARDLLHRQFRPQGHAALERAVADDARSYVKADDCDCGMELAATIVEDVPLVFAAA